MWLTKIYFLFVAAIMLRQAWRVSVRSYENFKRDAFFAVLYFTLFVASLNFLFMLEG